MIIKRIIVLVVLNVYPSVYSIGSYAWCSSYLLVHNKHTKACWLQTTIIVFSLMVSVDWEFRRVLAGGISWGWSYIVAGTVEGWPGISLFMWSQDLFMWSLCISWLELPHIMVASGPYSSLELLHKCPSKEGKSGFTFSDLVLKITNTSESQTHPEQRGCDRDLTCCWEGWWVPSW